MYKDIDSLVYFITNDRLSIFSRVWDKYYAYEDLNHVNEIPTVHIFLDTYFEEYFLSVNQKNNPDLIHIFTFPNPIKENLDTYEEIDEIVYDAFYDSFQDDVIKHNIINIDSQNI